MGINTQRNKNFEGGVTSYLAIEKKKQSKVRLELFDLLSSILE